MTVTYNDPTVTYNDPATSYNGGCVSTITYNEVGVAYNDPDITYNGCDHRSGAAPAAAAELVGGGRHARKVGPYTYRNGRLSPWDQTLLDDEELLLML